MRRTNATRAIREEAQRLRAQGLSFAKIGDRMGFSKQYAAKLLKSDPSGQKSSTVASTKESTETVNQLTPRERRFAKGLAEGKTQKDAALAAVEPGRLTEGSASQWASQTVKDPKFQRGFKEILDANGLSDEDLARVHRENLEATKVVGWDEDEEGRRRPLLHPDYATRQRAVVDGWKIRGRLKESPVEDTPQLDVLVITERQQKRLEDSFLDGKKLTGVNIKRVEDEDVDQYIDVQSEELEWKG